jgi:hypothetical protein
MQYCRCHKPQRLHRTAAHWQNICCDYDWPTYLSTMSGCCFELPTQALAGTASFARTYNDTCGLFAITLHKSIPTGAGPVPHHHLAGELQGTAGDHHDIV